MSIAQDALQILCSIGRRAWINQPSTAQRLHRFHGRTGVLICDGRGQQVFHFLPRDSADMAVAVDVDRLEISLGWPVRPAQYSCTETREEKSDA